MDVKAATIERWFRRIHWIMVVSGLSYMMYGSVWNWLSIYLHNPLTFSVETTHLHWNTTFPAISLCQAENGETIAEITEKHFGPTRDPIVDSLITDIAFYGGTCYSCEECLPSVASVPGLDCSGLRNFSQIVRRHRAPCEELLTDCYWQQDPLDCCRLFRPLDTEFGRCYSANAANFAAGVGQGAAATSPPRLVSNRATGPGRLRFRVLEDVQLYLHDEFSVPHAYVDRALRETVLWGMRKEIAVRVIEMENKDTVQELPIWRRNCRFPWEVVGGAHQLYRHYSFSACSLECFRRTQLEYCNCTHHLMPPALNVPVPAEQDTPVCSFEGLACLTEHSVEIAHTRKQCPCLSSCVEPEYFVVYKSEDYYPENEEEEGHVTVQLQSLPYERFVRNIAKTEMDLFIALGGLIGLFYGMSLLTTIDFLINLCRLALGSLRSPAQPSEAPGGKQRRTVDSAADCRRPPGSASK